MENYKPLRRAIPEGASFAQISARDGWQIRQFDWPVKGPDKSAGQRGRILFQGGRGDFIEKYLETFVHWHAAGWHITSFDWRGQGGSGRLSENPHVGHVEDFAPWVDDLADIFAAIRAQSSGPLVLGGHSMGGHLVMRALIEKRVAPDAVLLVAPMLGLRSTPFSPRIAGRIAHIMAGIGNPARPAWRDNERPSLPGASRRALLTHSMERYEDELWWKETKPELALGPPSWRWLDLAYQSTLDSFAPGALEGVDVPILLLCADHDRLVDPKAIHEAAARLPDAHMIRFGKESAHEILREGDAVRNRALAEIDHFLEERVTIR